MKDSNNNILWKYAGLTFQFMTGLGLFLSIGSKIDHWLKINTPLAIWILPLLFISSIIIKIIIETNTKK